MKDFAKVVENDLKKKVTTNEEKAKERKENEVKDDVDKAKEKGEKVKLSRNLVEEYDPDAEFEACDGKLLCLNKLHLNTKFCFDMFVSDELGARKLATKPHDQDNEDEEEYNFDTESIPEPENNEIDEIDDEDDEGDEDGSTLVNEFSSLGSPTRSPLKKKQSKLQNTIQPEY